MTTEITRIDKKVETDVSNSSSNKDNTDLEQDLESIEPNSEDSDETKNVETVNMANNWITAIIAIIVWLFLSLLNCYAIVELGITHGSDV